MFSIGEVWTQMQTGDPFALKAVKYNRRRKEGGDLLEIHEGILIQKEEAEKEKATTGGRPKTSMERVATHPKNPRHWDNHTANIRLLQEGTPTSLIKKVHIPLITEFNNQPVVP